MTRIVITESEIVQALSAAAAGQGPEEARTVAELMADTGLSVEKIRNALKAMQSAGRLTVHSVKRPALDGTMRHAPAYTVTPAPKRR